MGSGSRLEDYYHRIGEPSPTTVTSRTSSSSNDLSSDDQIRTQVLNVRMSLAEKRAQMEQERRMNDDLARERWDAIKRGAFLQAVGGSRRNVSQDGHYVDRYAYATGGDHEDDHDEYIASVHHHKHDQTEEDADDEDDQSFQLHQLSSESYSRCSNPPNNHHTSSSSNVYRNYDYEDLNGHQNRSDKHDYHKRNDSPDRRGSYNQSPELSRSASSSSSSSTTSDEDRHDEDELDRRESSENIDHRDFKNLPTASRMTSKERAEKTYSNTSNLDKEDETVPEYTCEKGFFISFADDKMPKPKPPVLRPKNIRAVTVGKDRRLSGSRTDLNNSNHHQTSHHPHHRLSKNDRSSSSLLSHSGSKIKDKDFASNDSDSIPFMLNSSESSKVESNDDVDSTRYSSHVSPSPLASSDLFSSEAPNTKSSNVSHQNIESAPLQKSKSTPIPSEGFVIGADTLNMDPISELEMARKKEMIIMQSLQRKADHEAKLRAKKLEIEKRCDLERQEQELKARKKEEERIRRQIILEKHRQRKARSDPEKDGNSSNFSNLSSRDLSRNSGTMLLGVRSRPRPSSGTKPRPKSLYVKTSDMQDYTSLDPGSSRLDSDSVDSSYPHFSSTLALNSSGSMNKPNSRPGSSMSNCNNMVKRLPSPTSRLPQIPPSLTMNRYRGPSSDGASDAGSTFSEYTGPKLYVKPAQKSNRGIILNAINVVLAGAVNSDTKKKVLEEINNSESKHFLILFRGSGMQFRGIYSYNPIIEEVVRLHGRGPKIVTDDMMDKFYKYNCGGRNFNEVLTKHLTVTIDAFTIHNTLWSGKRAMPAKTDSS